MARKFFGTDGVRGTANTPPMTAEMALRLGAAVGRYFEAGDHQHRVVIGKDTRRSGYMIENALTAGLTSVGANVLLLGPVPTPAVGMLTRSMRADLGVMISASHNPYHDNGIKFFGPDGYKLSDEAEEAIEALLESDIDLAEPSRIGRATRIEGDRARYVEFAKTTFPRGASLNGLKVVVDCANGAAYKTAPEVLWELGAEVVPVGVSPDGYNINKDCGSTNTRLASETVGRAWGGSGHLPGRRCRPDHGDRRNRQGRGWRSADGAGGRALGRRGQAGAWHAGGHGDVEPGAGAVPGRSRAAAGTHQGRRPLRGRGDARRRLQPGGRAVGHIVMSDYVTTGDGLIAGLQVLAAMVRSLQPASALVRQFEPVPQMLENVRYAEGTAPLETDAVRRVIADAEARIAGTGRLLIRKSGTEPLVRVMGEAEDQDLLRDVVQGVAAEIARAS